jgi:hypothetical protein
VGDEELAYTIERRLFDMGCAVHVVVGGNETAVLAGLAKMSLAAGLITICSVDSNDRGEAARARGIVGETSFVLVDAATLPTDRAAAAAAVCDVLLQKGVLRNPV